MKAIVQRDYGPDTLGLENVENPEGEVVVRVHAASLNQGDYVLMRGIPYIVRAVGFGLRRPKQPVPGQYFAGTVESTGEEVYGFGKAAFAEYVAVSEDAIAPKPRNLTFEQAAAVPHAGFAALQALRGRVEPGSKVLVTGASGAVGLMAVQIAKAMGAEVTALTSQPQFARELGADHVEFGTGYDLVIDNVADRSYRHALAPGGKLVMVAAGQGRWLGGVHRIVGAMLTRKLVPFLATPKREDLLALTELIEDGKVKVPVDRAFPLAEAAAAFRHHESRTTRGMIVVTP